MYKYFYILKIEDEVIISVNTYLNFTQEVRKFLLYRDNKLFPLWKTNKYDNSDIFEIIEQRYNGEIIFKEEQQ